MERLRLRPRIRLLLWRSKRFMPFLSLALGVGGALFMERTGARAPLVAAAAVVGWAVLIGLTVLRSMPVERLPGPLRRWRFRVQFSVAVGAQSVVQLCIFFVFPFFVLAAGPEVMHWLCLALLAATGVLATWDPLFFRILHRPILAIPLYACTAFFTLDCVLPMAGVPTVASFFAALALSLVTVPVAFFFAAPVERRLETLYRSAALSIGCAVVLFASAPLIPPAPLRLGEAAIGTELVDRRLADPAELLEKTPDQLVCATAIVAPNGLRDVLFHIWRHNGVRVDRVPLEIEGGRQRGFRTWSVKKNLGASPAGRWTCHVETKLGQSLGGASLRVRGRS